MPLMLERNSYDTVCHEHLEYYALAQVEWMSDRVGLRIVDVEFNETNGGSFSVAAAKISSSYAEFPGLDRKSTRLNSSHSQISYAVFCLKKKKNTEKVHSR